MARQSGAFPLRGTLGNITLRHTQDGYIAQGKTGPTTDQFWNDPKFENSRACSYRFGIASGGAKILRRMFMKAILNCYDNRQHSRLMRRLLRVIDSDSVSKKEERNFLCGDIRLLKDFWWNRNESIDNAMKIDFKVKVDRAMGEVVFTIPSFEPRERLKGNPGATHYRIIASAAEVNWINDGRVAEIHSTDYLPFDDNTSAPFNPVLLLTKGSTLPIVSCLTICWYAKVAGEMYILRDKKFNTAGVVGVDVV